MRKLLIWFLRDINLFLGGIIGRLMQSLTLRDRENLILQIDKDAEKMIKNKQSKCKHLKAKCVIYCMDCAKIIKSMVGEKSGKQPYQLKEKK